LFIFEYMEDKLHPLWEYFLWDYKVEVDFELPNLELIGMNDFAKKLHIRHKLLTQKKILEQQTHYRLLKRIIKEINILSTRQHCLIMSTKKGYKERRYWLPRKDGNIDIVLRVGSKEVFLSGMNGKRLTVPPDWVEVLRLLVNLRDILKLGEDKEEFWEYDKVKLVKEAKKVFRIGYEKVKQRQEAIKYEQSQISNKAFMVKEIARWNKIQVDYLNKQQEERKKRVVNQSFEDLFKDNNQ
jgi:hypothetical protein